MILSQCKQNIHYNKLDTDINCTNWSFEHWCIYKRSWYSIEIRYKECYKELIFITFTLALQKVAESKIHLKTQNYSDSDSELEEEDEITSTPDLVGLGNL